ncbi:hypothetical protein AT6N2_C0719 [Agrobacterium tumefaciens]|nr:hypothetical protein AT6N2_C0719 [Agrobacterium tumefaciens]
MVAAGNVDCACVRHDGGQFLTGPGNIVLRSDRNQRRRVDLCRLLARDENARRLDTGGKRQTVAFRLVGEGAEHAAALMGHHIERWSQQGLRNRVPVAHAFHHADAEATKHQGANTLWMRHGQKRGNTRAHGIAHHMGFRDAQMIEQRHRVVGHDRGIISLGIMWLVACAMAAIVDGNHPVAGVTQRLQPAGMHPVDIGAGRKAVDQQNRVTRRITLVKIGKAKTVMGKIGKLRRVEIHQGHPFCRTIWQELAMLNMFR